MEEKLRVWRGKWGLRDCNKKLNLLLTNTILGICWFGNQQIKGSLPKLKSLVLEPQLKVPKKVCS